MNGSADGTKLRPDTGSPFTALAQQIAEADSVAALRIPADVVAAQWPEMANDPLMLPLLENLLRELVRKSAQLENRHIGASGVTEFVGRVTSRTGNRDK